VLVFLQRKVQLLSPDKQTFEVEWDVAMRSTVVKQMLEGRFVLAFVHKLILSDTPSSTFAAGDVASIARLAWTVCSVYACQPSVLSTQRVSAKRSKHPAPPSSRCRFGPVDDQSWELRDCVCRYLRRCPRARRGF
jgi:hypothetical protein